MAQDGQAPQGGQQDESQSDPLLSDAGWENESLTPDSAMQPTPDDTTLRSADATQEAVEATEEGESAEQVDETPSESETGSKAPPAAAAADTKPEKKARKKTAKERIDEVTWQRAEAERRETEARQRADEAQRKADEFQRRLEALERSTPQMGESQPKAEAPPEAPADAGEMPEHPDYQKFNSDEEYQSAVTQWKKDVHAWHARSIQSIESRVTKNVTETNEARQNESRLEEARRNAEASAAQRVGAAMQAHPDMQERLQDADVQRMLGSVTAESQNAGRFLMDLVVNTDDGGELYYDLVSRPEETSALLQLPIPTRALADAVRQSPARRAIMQHFSTAEGRSLYHRLLGLHPVSAIQEIGILGHALSTSAASRGSAPSTPAPVSRASAPARPPVGSPSAHVSSQPDEDAMDLEQLVNLDEERRHKIRQREFGLA